MTVLKAVQCNDQNQYIKIRFQVEEDNHRFVEWIADSLQRTLVVIKTIRFITPTELEVKNESLQHILTWSLFRFVDSVTRKRSMNLSCNTASISVSDALSNDTNCAQNN